MRGFFESSLVQKEAPTSLIPKCGSCGLYKTCQSPKMKPYGKGRVKVLLVGEAPGQTEDEEGRPFVGKSGQYLRDVLHSLDVDMDKDCLVTNALICRPKENKIHDMRMIDYCRPNVRNVIETFKPNVIVTLGKVPLVSVIRPHWKETIRELEGWTGWQIPVQAHWVCPTYHPSYLLRSNNQVLERMFRNHLQKAFDLTEPPPAQPNYAKHIEIIYDDNEACRALRDIDHAGGWAAFDYETNCLKPELPKSRIVSCAASNGDRTIAYPWVGKSIEGTLQFVKSKRTRKIASNLKMEQRWTVNKLGTRVRRFDWDTMVAAHVIDSRPKITSLKFQAFVNFGVDTYNENVEPYLSSDKKTPYNRIEEIDLETLLHYNGLDAILEYKLAMLQRQILGYND